MDINVFNNKVIAHFAFRQTCQAIFKLIRKEEVDALIFACRQKRHDLKVQQGRSMIEMLGVLAIIGVLSVGGIAGYAKAMERYRINETINQITHIVQNTRDLFKTQPNFYGDLSATSSPMSTTDYSNRVLADRAKIFPTSIVKNDYKNLWGGYIRYYVSGKFADNDNKAFILTFTEIPQEACIELATRDWQSGLGLVAMKFQGSKDKFGIDKGTYIGGCTTQQVDGAALVCANDMPTSVDFAVTACDMKKGNQLKWKFY